MQEPTISKTTKSPIGALPLPQKIPEMIYKLLKDGILSGKLTPGSRININEMVEQLSISKIPIREALRMLEVEGWVISQPHRGSYVRPLSRQELSDVFEMRKLMEPYSARLAARNNQSEGIQALQSIIRKTRTAINRKDTSAIAEMNRLMHQSIATAGGNKLLTESLEKLDLLMRRYFAPLNWEQREHSMLQHEAIVQAIAEGDEALAERLTLDHICHTESLAYLAAGHQDKADLIA